jgi:hypothetical protein
MLIHPMAERLRGLGLTAMADAFLDTRNQSAADELSREDWLGLLIDREVTARDNKRLGRRLSLARLRRVKASGAAPYQRLGGQHRAQIAAGGEEAHKAPVARRRPCFR